MARTSKRTSEELTHVSSPKLAAIMGTSVSAIRNWKEIATFPKPNKKGEWCVRDCLIWYLANRAPRNLQTDLHQKLSAGLGIQSAAVSSEQQAAPVSKSTRDNLVQEQMQLLDLKTKQAKYEREFGDLVRIRDVETILVGFMRKVRELMEAIERVTGHPVGTTMDKIVAATLREIAETKGGAVCDRND